MVVKNRRAFELKLGKLGLTLFVSGMSILLFSTFFFGVLVGEHLDAYPERYSGGLADLVRDRFSGLAIVPKPLNQPPAHETAIDEDPAQEKGEFGLTFYKVLGENNDGKQGGQEQDSGKNDINTGTLPSPVVSGGDASAAADIPPVPIPDKGVVKKAHSGSLPSEGKENKNIAGNNKKIPVEKTSPEPSAGQDGTGIEQKVLKGGFQVQAAAYTEVHQAEKMVKRLKNMGFYPTIQPREIPGKGKWFRVIVGEFEDRSKAELAAGKINEKIKGVKCVIRRNKGGGA